MHLLDVNKMHRKKVKWEIYKKAMCCLEQILVAITHETVAVRSLASHLTNYSKKMNMQRVGTTAVARTNS